MSLALFIGNCQMASLMTYFKYNEEFTKRYVDIKFYANWEILNNTLSLPIKDLQRASLIIYQPLSDVHGCLSMNSSNKTSIFKYISEDTITISVPRIHNNALWPIFSKNASKSHIYGYAELPENLSLEQTLSLYDSNKLDFQFEARFARNKQISLEKEKDTDIKIFDYIEHNISKQLTFLTQDHPTSHVFTELYRQVCDLLDVPYIHIKQYDKDDNLSNLPDSSYNLPGDRLPISDYSKQFYGFSYPYVNHVDANKFYRDVIISCKS